MIVRTTADTTLRTKPYDGAYGGMIATIAPGAKLEVVETRDTDIGKHGKVWFTGITTSQGAASFVRQSPGWIELKTTEPVTVEPPPEPAITFTATPASITAGQSSRLSWSVSGVDGVYLDNVGVAGSGDAAFKVVTPSVTTTYTLRVVYGGTYTVSKAVTVTVTPAPQPPPTGNYRYGMIGVHCIGDVAAGREAVRRGCKMVTVMDNYIVARELAAQGVLVLYRQYQPWYWTGEQHAAKVREAAGGQFHDNIIHLPPYNECDHICYGTPDQIAVRGQQEAAYVRLMRGWGCRVAIGGFSVGCPDYTNQAICDKLREYYAPLFNDDDPNDPHVFLSYHGYSARITDLLNMGASARSMLAQPSSLPDESQMERRVILVGRDQHEAVIMVPRDAGKLATAAYDPIWLECRSEFAFLKCGLRPDKLPAVVEDEGATEDEGGIGGAKAHNRTPDEMRRYMPLVRQVKSRPMVINGKTYRSQWRGSTQFMYGEDAKWTAGFDHRGYTPVLEAEAWTWVSV